MGIRMSSITGWIAELRIVQRHVGVMGAVLAKY